MIEQSEMAFLKGRFDKVDADNAEIKKELVTVHAKVDRHSVYWDIIKWSVPSGGLAAVLGWFGFHKH